MKRISEFGNVIIAICQYRNISFAEFGRRINFTGPYINDLLKGNRKPSINVINGIVNNMSLLPDETVALYNAYYKATRTLPDEVLDYIYSQDLIAPLKELAISDPTGSIIKNNKQR